MQLNGSQYSPQNTIDSLPTGEYTVTIQDANFCEASVAISVDSFPGINIA